jgi:hypothetical protein
VIVKRVRADVLEVDAWDVAISRATFSPDEWLEVGEDLVRDGGEIWVLLAKDDAPTDISIEPKIRQLETFEYNWPNSGHPRRAVRYVKSAI